jgi:hypothetical protein
MHANELLKRIVSGIHHHTEAEREAMLAAVDIAFPVKEAEPDPADDEDQAAGVLVDTGIPGTPALPAQAVFSDVKAPAGA